MNATSLHLREIRRKSRDAGRPRLTFSFEGRINGVAMEIELGMNPDLIPKRRSVCARAAPSQSAHKDALATRRT